MVQRFLFLLKELIEVLLLLLFFGCGRSFKVLPHRGSLVLFIAILVIYVVVFIDEVADYCTDFLHVVGSW